MSISKCAWRHYRPAELSTFASHARNHSQHATARMFNISRTTVRRAMRLHGVKARRVGNYRNAEMMEVAS